jgi:hypothetical protein
MSWDKVPQRRGAPLPEPPKQERPRRLNRHGEWDGRQSSADYKERQFNPRVRDQFIADFKELQNELQEQSDVKITQAYVLELLMAIYKQSQGENVHPFGLSDEAMKGAEKIAAHNGWTLSEAVEDALSARLQHFDLLEGRGKRKE